MSLAEFIYTVILRPSVLRSACNRLIVFVLPSCVRVGDAKIAINPEDPVISGALFFGVYENAEIKYIRRACEKNDIVVDVGANVGLYTAIAGKLVGAGGRVISIEPDPQSFAFLERTVALNGLTNVELLSAAASDINGCSQLYTSSQNRGDNRLYAMDTADSVVEVPVVRLDDYLVEQGITKIDVLKIDVQGYEGHVIDGLKETLRRSSDVKILLEFWPSGLRAAGSDPIALLQNLKRMGFTAFRLKPRGSLVPLGDDESTLVKSLRGRKYANLVLVRRGAEPNLRA